MKKRRTQQPMIRVSKGKGPKPRCMCFASTEIVWIRGTQFRNCCIHLFGIRTQRRLIENVNRQWITMNDTKMVRHDVEVEETEQIFDWRKAWASEINNSLCMRPFVSHSNIIYTFYFYLVSSLSLCFQFAVPFMNYRSVWAFRTDSEPKIYPAEISIWTVRLPAQYRVDCARSHVCSWTECVVVSKQDSPYRLWLFIIISWKTKNTRFWGELRQRRNQFFNAGNEEEEEEEEADEETRLVFWVRLSVCELKDLEFLDCLLLSLCSFCCKAGNFVAKINSVMFGRSIW